MLKIAFFRDGPFLPPQEGGSESLLGLMGKISAYAKVFLFRCYRGWDDYRFYLHKPFTTIFIKPRDFYSNKSLYRHLIDKYQVDVCHFDSAEAICLQADLVGNKVLKVWEVHNVNHVLIEQLKENQREIQRAIRFECQAGRKSDLILVRSKKDVADLIEVGIERKKITKYRGCISIENYQFCAGRSDKKEILFLGNMFYGPNENAVKLIQDRIIPLVLAQLPQAKFTFVGNYPSYLAERIRENPERVKFTGAVNNLNRILIRVRVALAPLKEGSGTRLKILAYLSAGIPTIATNLAIEGLERSIRQHLIIEDDIEKYPRLIVRLFSQKYSKERLRAARKWVENNYLWEEEAARIAKLFWSALLLRIRDRKR